MAETSKSHWDMAGRQAATKDWSGPGSPEQVHLVPSLFVSRETPLKSTDQLVRMMNIQNEVAHVALDGELISLPDFEAGHPNIKLGYN